METGDVSIQVMSPTSGDKTKLVINGHTYEGVSIQVMSPTSGDQQKEISFRGKSYPFPFK